MSVSSAMQNETETTQRPTAAAIIAFETRQLKTWWKLVIPNSAPSGVDDDDDASKKDDDEKDCLLLAQKIPLSFYCTQCRFSKEENQDQELLRCTRCQCIYYCSRECQRRNFPLHKRMCQSIAKLRQKLEKEDEANSKTKAQITVLLAFQMMELGFLSYDTVERGSCIYHQALFHLFQVIATTGDASMERTGIAPCWKASMILLAALGYMHTVHTLLTISMEKGLPGVRDAIINEFFSEETNQDNSYMNQFGSIPSVASITEALPVWIQLALLLVWTLEMSKTFNNKASATCVTTEKLKGDIQSLCMSLQRCHPEIWGAIPPDGKPLSREQVNEDLFLHNGDDDESVMVDFYTLWMVVKDSFALTPGVMDILPNYVDYER